MNIEKANTIAISEILAKANIFPESETETTLFYCSPIRISHKADFEVDKKTNTWFDPAVGIGGHLVDLVCEYLKFHRRAHTEFDALRYITIMSDHAPRIRLTSQEPMPTAALTIERDEPLLHPGLFNLITSFGIDLHTAMRHLKEITAFDQSTRIVTTCLGCENESGGFRLTTEENTVLVGERDIRFIRGLIPKPDGIHIFKNIFDFLSVLTVLKLGRLNDDVIISYDCLELVSPYLYEYGYKKVTTWFHNDEEGKRESQAVAEFARTQNGLIHKKANAVYANKLSVNDWHRYQHNIA